MSHSETRNKSDILAPDRRASWSCGTRRKRIRRAPLLSMNSLSVRKLSLHHDSRQAKHAQQHTDENQELALPWIDLPLSIEIVSS